MDKNISLIEYIGVYNDLVIALLSFVINDSDSYEITFTYNDKQFIIEYSDDIPIEHKYKRGTDEYSNLIKSILKVIKPYNELDLSELDKFR